MSWKNKIDIQRGVPGVQPRNNPGLMKLDLTQVQELMTKYGPIDVVFLDGEPQGPRDLAWKLQPNTIVTRGAQALRCEFRRSLWYPRRFNDSESFPGAS